MNLRELAAWQWTGYARYHGSRANLLLHIVAVPLFLAGNLALVGAAWQGSWTLAIAAIAAMAISVALQGRGHRIEEVPPEPFTGAANAVGRIFVEQWVTFPRFVASGAWLRAVRKR